LAAGLIWIKQRSAEVIVAGVRGGISPGSARDKQVYLKVPVNVKRGLGKSLSALPLQGRRCIEYGFFAALRMTDDERGEGIR
jgi:hypothetical protein